jgi:hypothetical protein
MEPPDPCLPDATSQDNLLQEGGTEAFPEPSEESLGLGGKAPLPTIVSLSGGR